MTSGCVLLGRVWVCGRSAGRSDSCASREPPSQDWLDNWQPRGIPCGPLSSRACKSHLNPARFAGVRLSWQMRRTFSVEVAYRCAQQVRDVFHQDTPAQGRRLAARLIESLPACPIPEIARIDRTLHKWKDALDAYFDTAGASNAPHRSHQRTLSN